jgi:hypothetical protein
MAELILRSPRQRSLKSLVEAALQNELRLLQAGIRRSRLKLQELETRYEFSTDEFLQRYENNQLQETLEFTEWVGEHRLMQRLQEKAQTLQEIKFAD